MELRRKRLIFRSGYRGMKELDIVMGAFADRYVAAFDGDELRQYEAILDVPDSDLLDWLCGKSPVPDAMSSPVMRKLMDFEIAKTLR